MKKEIMQSMMISRFKNAEDLKSKIRFWVKKMDGETIKIKTRDLGVIHLTSDREQYKALLEKKEIAFSPKEIFAYLIGIGEEKNSVEIMRFIVSIKKAFEGTMLKSITDSNSCDNNNDKKKKESK